MAPADSYQFHDLHPDTENFRGDVLSGLALPQKALPPKYFYDARGSELFEAICDLPEYYPTRTELAMMERDDEPAQMAYAQALSDFALSMADLKPSNLTFVTTPYKLIGDGNVHWTEETAALWKALRDEQPWPPVDASASPSPETSASAEPTETAAAGLVTPPSSVRVTILNGTKSNGLARQVAKELKDEGFVIASVGTAPKPVTATVIKYNAKFRTGADTLAYAARTGNLVVDNSLTKTIVLVIGPDWLGIQDVVMPTPSASAQPGVVNAGSNVCSEGNNRVKTK